LYIGNSNLERITLRNFLGNYEEALRLLQARRFHPWEGGEGKVTGQYVLSQVELGKQALLTGDFEKAIACLEEAQTYPENLGEGKLHGALGNDIFYWLGNAYAALDRNDDARAFWKKATGGMSEPSPAMYYNDQQPDKIFYQGLALRKLGNNNEACSRFQKLVDYGEKHISDEVKIDYFAVSLPDMMIWEDDLNIRNNEHCLYLIALSNIGYGKFKKAEDMLQSILNRNNYHQGAFNHLKLIRSNLFSFIKTEQ
jgi:tetratricopeptide (TPR) repeat protein